MKKSCLLLLVSCFIFACAKNDPILPGERTAIFPVVAPVVKQEEVPADHLTEMYESLKNADTVSEQYMQDKDNVIWQIVDGGDNRRIFSGIPTMSKINIKRTPVYSKDHVFAGLSTGEVVKINPKNRDIKWIADVYLEHSVTGGNPVLDITSLSVVDGGVFAGGLGGKFCKLSEKDGRQIWCEKISPAGQALVSKNLIFVVGSNHEVYAVNASTGGIYWSTKTKRWGHEFELREKSGQFLLVFPSGKIDAKTGKFTK